MEITLDASATIEDLISSYHNLNEIYVAGQDVSEIGSFGSELLGTLKEQETLSLGLEYFLQNDIVFSKYLKQKVQYSKEDYKVAVEGMIKDVATALYNFFKRLVSGIMDFVKKAFGLQRNVSATNESNLKRSRALFDRNQTELKKIRIPESVPTRKDFTDVVDELGSIMRELCKVDVGSLDDDLNKILDGKSEKISFSVNYEKYLGKNYITRLKSVGIVFDDDMPTFQTVFANTATNTTIDGAGYNYGELLELSRKNENEIRPLHGQMDRMIKALDKVTNNISRLRVKLKDDEENSERFKEILEVLPREVSKLISLYHKVISAMVAYEYKLADIIRCIYEALKSYSKE